MFDYLYDSDTNTWFPKFEFDQKADVLDEIDKAVDKADVELSDSDKVEKAQNEKNSIRNKEIADKIFAIFEHYGFHAENKDYGNGYFIIDMGDNSVVHFNFKGFWIKDWKFGMWIHSEYLDKDEPCLCRTEKKYPTVEIFAQHKDCIDKFKPSASSICFDIFNDDVKDILDTDVDKLDRKSTFELPFSLWNIFRCIKFMKYHPCMTFAGLCGHKAYACETKFGFFLDFIYYRTKFHVSGWLRRFMTRLSFHYNMARMRLLTLSRNIESIVVVDWNAKNDGFRTSYDYEVWINFSSHATDLDAFSFINRWFPKIRFGFVGGHGFPDHLFEIQEIHRYDSDVDENFVSVFWFKSDYEAKRCIADRIEYYGMGGLAKESKTFADYCKSWNLEYEGERTFKVAQTAERLKAEGNKKFKTIGCDTFFTKAVISKKDAKTIAAKIMEYDEIKAAKEVKSDVTSDSDKKND